MDWPRAAHSMIGRERMNQLQEAMETVVRENIEEILLKQVYGAEDHAFYEWFYKQTTLRIVLCGSQIHLKVCQHRI